VAITERIQIPSNTATQVKLPILRGIASVVLILAGSVVSLASLAAASGLGRGPQSFGGLVIAALGLSLMFAGYWIIRDMDGALLAAVCLKLALAVGSSFLVVGLLAILFALDGSPIAYFIVLGCICTAGFLKFRAYTRDR
jgi:hypothetical protein